MADSLNHVSNTTRATELVIRPKYISISFDFMSMDVATTDIPCLEKNAPPSTAPIPHSAYAISISCLTCTRFDQRICSSLPYDGRLCCCHGFFAAEIEVRWFSWARGGTARSWMALPPLRLPLKDDSVKIAGFWKGFLNRRIQREEAEELTSVSSSEIRCWPGEASELVKRARKEARQATRIAFQRGVSLFRS